MPISCRRAGLATGRLCRRSSPVDTPPRRGVHQGPCACSSTRVLVAFQLATSSRPGASRSSSAAAEVISAASGCGVVSPTRTRFPRDVTETTIAGRWFRAEPACGASAGVEGDLPGKDADLHPPLGRRNCGDLASAVEQDPGQAVGGSTGAPREHDRAGEVGDEGGGGSGGDVVRGAALDDPPGVEDADLVAQERGLGEVVGDEQGGHARLAEDGRDLTAGARARAGVESGERLVEQQHIRRARQRAGERDPLPLSAREGRWLRVGPVGQAEALEQRQRCRATIGAGSAPRP